MQWLRTRETVRGKSAELGLLFDVLIDFDEVFELWSGQIIWRSATIACDRAVEFSELDVIESVPKRQPLSRGSGMLHYST